MSERSDKIDALAVDESVLLPPVPEAVKYLKAGVVIRYTRLGPHKVMYQEVPAADAQGELAL